MKKFSRKIGIMILCSSIFCQAENSELCNQPVIELSEKYYIASKQIIFADKKIYISVNDEKYETPTLFSDENGYYIQKVVDKCTGRCSWYEWECGCCGFCNLYELQCGHCQGMKTDVKCR